MNIRLLRRIQKQILKEPRQFHMEGLYTNNLPWKIPNCGTAACIFGWGIALKAELSPLQVDRSALWGAPEGLFGISSPAAERLMYCVVLGVDRKDFAAVLARGARHHVTRRK